MVFYCERSQYFLWAASCFLWGPHLGNLAFDHFFLVIFRNRSPLPFWEADAHFLTVNCSTLLPQR